MSEERERAELGGGSVFGGRGKACSLRFLCGVAPGSFAETKPVGSGHAWTWVSPLFCQQRLPHAP